MNGTSVISIIDDDDLARSGMMTLVRSAGFIAHAFPSAHAFLQSEQLNQTSCLISDVQMPEMNGLQLLDDLSERGFDIPIIFVTAFYDDKMRARALDRGAICFLRKPFDDETLLRCVETALR